MMQPLRAAALSAMLLGVLGLSDAALAQGDFTAVQATVNPVMRPKTPTDVFQECANNATCRALVDTAAVYLGVPPGRVSAALAIVPQARRAGEEGWYTVKLPNGYQYCRSTIKMISVVPATGDRASVFSARANKDNIGMYTWTPKQGLGGGRSWVEAVVTLYGVRDNKADQYRAMGTCKPYGMLLLGCRGARGVNKGKPACKTVQH